LSSAEKKEIARLTLQGEKQINIARKLSCGLDCVRTWQKRLLGHVRRPLDAKAKREVLALLRRGLGQYPVSKATGISQPQVHALMRAYDIDHKTGGLCLKQTDPAKYAAIVASVRRRENYIKAIAKRFSVVPSTVANIAHQIFGPGRFLSAPVRPPLSQESTRRWDPTATEKRKIRERTLARDPQATIARSLHIDLKTLNRWQVWMRLPTRVPIPEKNIMLLFNKGWGGYRIAKHLHVAVSAVYKVAHQNNFRRADNVGYPTPKENEAAFIEAVKRREDYIVRLAEKYKIGICKAQRLAREVLATPRFRPGASKPVLSSDFPQKHFDPRMGDPDKAVLLVSEITRRFFGGKLPEDTTQFVASCLQLLVPADIPPEFRETFSAVEWEKAKENCAFHLVQAVDCLRRQQEARWQN
jgi:transposase-like protein